MIKKFKLSFMALAALLALMTPLLAQPDLPQANNTRGLPDSSKIVRSLQASPDGKWLAATFSESKREAQTNRYVPARASMQVWDARTGEPKWGQEHAGTANLTLLFSPDSNRLLFTKLDFGVVGNPQKEVVYVAQLHDAATGKVLSVLERESQERLGGLLFTPDGKQILGASSGNEHRDTTGSGFGFNLWDVETGKRGERRWGLLSLEKIAAFSANGQRILTHTLELNVKEQKVSETRLAVRSWPGLELLETVSLGPIRAENVAVSPDGNRVALVKFQTNGYQATREFETLIWNIKDDKLQPVELPAAANYSVSTLEFLPDGATVMGSGRGFNPKGFPQTELWFWNAQSGELERIVTEEEMGFRGFGFSQHTLLAPKEKKFYRVNRDATVELRSLEDGSLIRSFEAKE